MIALILNESALDPFIIGDNTDHRAYRSATRVDAERIATRLIAQGHSIDMGLAQINSRTARRIGLTVSDAFDACANIAAAGRMMVSTYRRLAPQAASAQHALAATLSTYNTGNSLRGFQNGYVARVYRAAARSVAFVPQARATPPSPTQTAVVASPAPAAVAPQPSWAVFETASGDAFVFQPEPKGR